MTAEHDTGPGVGPDPDADLGSGTVTEFTADGYRWFDVTLNPDTPFNTADQTVVAMASINLDAAGLILDRQRIHNPDPITRILLARQAGGHLEMFTWGDLEFHDDCRHVLNRLGTMALAAGAITEVEWAELVTDEDLDQLPKERNRRDR